MAWRIAFSLEELRNEVNARWPNRSKASDGVIGDASHAASASDHNPNGAGVVCAFDITHDPVNGPDIAQLGRELLVHPHRDAKYFIFNGQIASRAYNWTLRSYRGDPHSNHIHVSVGVGPDGRSVQPYDDRDPWLSGAPAPAPTPPPATPAPPFPYPSDHYLGEPSPSHLCHSGFYGGIDTLNVLQWQRHMAVRGWGIGADGKYGPQSSGICRQFQAEKGLGVDGLVGPQTWAMTWTSPVT